MPHLNPLPSPSTPAPRRQAGTGPRRTQPTAARADRPHHPHRAGTHPSWLPLRCLPQNAKPSLIIPCLASPARHVGPWPTPTRTTKQSLPSQAGPAFPVAPWHASLAIPKLDHAKPAPPVAPNGTGPHQTSPVHASPATPTMPQPTGHHRASPSLFLDGTGRPQLASPAWTCLAHLPPHHLAAVMPAAPVLARPRRSGNHLARTDIA